MNRLLVVTLVLAFAVTVSAGCSHEPLPSSGQQMPVTQPKELTQDEVKRLATEFKREWLQKNPVEAEQIGQATVREVKKTETGWHTLFEQVRFPGQPEGESHHFLHIYIDSNGNLERIVRGPDEIT